MTYYQYGERKTVSVDEFIEIARDTEGWEVPTFRMSLVHLWNSLQRKRVLRKRIPDLPTAITYLEGREMLSVERYNKPSEWEWKMIQEGRLSKDGYRDSVLRERKDDPEYDA